MSTLAAMFFRYGWMKSRIEASNPSRMLRLSGLYKNPIFLGTSHKSGTNIEPKTLILGNPLYTSWERDFRGMQASALPLVELWFGDDDGDQHSGCFLVP